MYLSVFKSCQGSLSADRGGPFSVLNGVLANDALAICVDANITVDAPVHILYLSTGGVN